MKITRSSGHGHAALRRGRTSTAGQIYLVTFTTHNRSRLFADPARAMTAARALVDPRCWTRSHLLAWVLMPDHWHGLVALGEDDALPGLIRRIKTSTARCVRRDQRHAGPVWARAYHDHALRKEEDLLGAARYLVMNPVRAGLVRRCGSYPYWDAVWL
ncbi:transposase [Lysobacter maris]|uniref:Transposase n=1 Tax=Marilutibacter maris TaxID=1605891 RepID=A0A508AS93_9GAMM|nr:transposase [Lysobacter maris]KAB8188525.1 transposase [Lysobacter maris]